MKVPGMQLLFWDRGHAFKRALLVIVAPAFLSIGLSGQSTGEPYLQSVLAVQQRIQAGDLEGARSLLLDATRRYPSNGGLENLLGIVEIRENHADLAKKDFTDAIRHDPKLVGAYLNLARIDLESSGDDKLRQAETLHLYETALRLDPSNSEANYQAANILMWEGKYQSSLDHVARLKADERSQVGVQGLVCADQAGLGRREAANRAASAFIANPDLSEDDAVTILPALRIARRADLIERIFAAVDSQHPLSTQGLRIFGLAQEANGEFLPARATLEKAYAADPSAVTPLIDLARIANDAQDYTGALGYLAHARDLSPKDASLPFQFGVICAKLNLIGESRKALEDAIKLDPDNPQYNFGLGVVASLGHDPLQALPYLQKFHDLKPGDPSGLLAFGKAYFRAKDYDNASIWLQKASTLRPTASEAHYYLGRIARQKSEFPAAIAELQQAETLDPDRAEVLAELGQVYVQTKNYAEAAKKLHRAVALDSDNYSANFGLLQLYARTNDPRREQQAKRFGEVKDKSDEMSREMMREIEVAPNGAPAK